MIETILLLVSVSINVLFVLYAKWLIGIIRTKEQDAQDLANITAEYVGHVKSVHEMEMFYGDETLKSLISHGSSMIEKIEEYDYLVLFEDGEEDIADESNS